jgi:DNA-binding transcriptional regulator LsrR (DeoR family)
MNAPARPATSLPLQELQVINRFRHQRLNTYEIAKSLHLAEHEVVRLLASAREKERAAG